MDRREASLAALGAVGSAVAGPAIAAYAVQTTPFDWTMTGVLTGFDSRNRNVQHFGVHEINGSSSGYSLDANGHVGF